MITNIIKCYISIHKVITYMLHVYHYCIHNLSRIRLRVFRLQIKSIQIIIDVPIIYDRYK